MEYILGIIGVVIAITFYLYRKGKKITNKYIEATDKVAMIFGSDKIECLKDFPNNEISNKILKDYELSNDLDFAIKTLSSSEKNKFAQEIQDIMIIYISEIMYKDDKNAIIKTLSDLKSNSEFKVFFIVVKQYILGLFGIAYLDDLEKW